MLPALDATANEGAECLVGNIRLDLDPVKLSSEALDLATVPLSGPQLNALEADGYRIIRPTQWPPPALADRDPVLVAGFPGAWRRQISWDTLDLPGTTKLALVHHLREDEFVCQLDPAFVDRDVVVHDDLAEDELPGMSGGPALLVRQETVVVPHLCGILKQGVAFEGGNRLLYFTRVNRIALDGTMQD